MSWLDVLGWTGSAILVLSLLQARVLRFRIVNTLGTFVLLVFNGLINVWPMVGMNAVLLAINLWFIAKLVRERHDDAVFEVVEVERTDPLLRHLLEAQGDDIARFQPGRTWEPLADRDHAFVVLRGTEFVGAVLLDADGDVARVRLDYVVPRFRDFTPGEFVWRKSGVLKELGFRHVMTPPGMVGAYYGAVGFRPNGQEYVLDL